MGVPLGGASGSSTWKMEPPPVAGVTVIVPCISSVSSLAMARPSPVPPKSRVVPACACRKRSKIACRMSGGTPGPESCTSIRQRSRPVRRTAQRTRPPGGVNLKALDSRFCRIRSVFSGSSTTGSASGTEVT